MFEIFVNAWRLKKQTVKKENTKCPEVFFCWSDFVLKIFCEIKLLFEDVFLF